MPGSELSERPIPENAEEWLHEIAEAYADAEDTLPFAEILGDTIEEELLSTIAPMVALKFRGIPRCLGLHTAYRRFGRKMSATSILMPTFRSKAPNGACPGGAEGRDGRTLVRPSPGFLH